MNAVDLIFNLDKHLNQWATDLGPWLYLLLFGIIFCETGLVVTPILPGDTLLFAVGALAASKDSALSLPFMIVLLWAAAVLGDAANYAVGLRVGPKVFASETSRLLNKKHLLRTQEFYQKHGGKTIVLARFIPILRTFAPFVAGIGKMKYRRFALFNLTGGLAWILTFSFLGYFFGNLPLVKNNFSFVIVAILLISALPVAMEYVRARREARSSSEAKPSPKEVVRP